MPHVTHPQPSVEVAVTTWSTEQVLTQTRPFAVHTSVFCTHCPPTHLPVIATPPVAAVSVHVVTVGSVHGFVTQVVPLQVPSRPSTVHFVTKVGDALAHGFVGVGVVQMTQLHAAGN